MKKLRFRMSSKLKSTAGESIAEVLIALLIAALALTMLASVISTSAKIITNSKTAMNAYYEQRNELDAGTSELVDSDTLTLQITKKQRSDSATGETGGLVKLKQDQENTTISVNSYSIDLPVTTNTPVVAYYWP